MQPPPGTEVDLRPIKRLASALYAAGERGGSRKHDLMLRAAGVICEIESLLTIIHQAMERGDHDLVKLRVQDITQVLGCENIVMKNVDTAQYTNNMKQASAQNCN